MRDYSKLESDLELATFRRFHFSNSSWEERSRELSLEMKDYVPNHLSIAVPEDIEDEDRRHNVAELKLAKLALKCGCVEVSNIYYGAVYSARGWLRK